MTSLKTTIRKGDASPDKSRQNGILPGVLYGEGIKNLNLAVSEKDFLKVLKTAGESSLITLTCGKDEFGVLIHDVQRDPVSGKVIHIDFFHPSLKKKIEAEVPLVFEGESLAVRDLGGILEKEIQQVQVKGLAKDLPREIRVNLSTLNTFQDKVVIGDLKVPQAVEILHHASTDIIAHVKEPKKEEEKKETPAVEETPVVEEEKT